MVTVTAPSTSLHCGPAAPWMHAHVTVAAHADGIDTQPELIFEPPSGSGTPPSVIWQYCVAELQVVLPHAKIGAGASCAALS